MAWAFYWRFFILVLVAEVVFFLLFAVFGLLIA